jgi:hypothetical protein
MTVGDECNLTLLLRELEIGRRGKLGKKKQ